jgi:hypothetical protein
VFVHRPVKGGGGLGDGGGGEPEDDEPQAPQVTGQVVVIVEPCVAWAQYGVSCEQVAGEPPMV